MMKLTPLRTASVRPLVACLAASVVALGPAPASAEDPTCRGLTATIVGGDSDVLTGTDGDDVIVTNDVVVVEAGAGDDVICSTYAGTGDGDFQEIKAGPGHDVVDTTAASLVRTYTLLGAGDDTFVGGDVADFVGPVRGTDQAEGTDAVSTGAGTDNVVTGGDSVVADGDALDLGPGDDMIEVYGAIAGATYSGGDGMDRLVARSLGDPATWVFDLTAGIATRDAVAAADLDSFEGLNLTRSETTHLTVVGTDGADEVESWRSVDVATLGAGDDLLTLPLGKARLARTMSIDGGAGSDGLRLGRTSTAGDVDLDLGAGTLRFVRPRTTGTTSSVAGFESTNVVSKWLRIFGTRADDVIDWTGCLAHVTGRGGDDEVTFRFVFGQWIDCLDFTYGADVTVEGGRGDDRLVGGPLPDRLYGGRGFDHADGGDRRDLCRTERVVRCERR